MERTILFLSSLPFSIYHASYYSFKDGRYSGFNGVASNNAFASNGVMIPAPIASGIPLIAATPAKVLNKRAESYTIGICRCTCIK